MCLMISTLPAKCISAEYGQSRKLAFVNASMQYERSTEIRSNDAANTRYDTYIHAIHIFT